MKRAIASSPPEVQFMRTGIFRMLVVLFGTAVLLSIISFAEPSYANTENRSAITTQDSLQNDTVERIEESNSNSEKQADKPARIPDQSLPNIVSDERTSQKDDSLDKGNNGNTEDGDQAAQTPANPSEPIEKGLAFHASDTSPHLTAFLDGKETAQSGWVFHEGFWYWFNKSPYAAENSWIKTGGGWYYLDETGEMKTGAFSDGNRTYLSDPSGRMLSDGWHRSGGVWYWLESSGAAKTGWLHDRGAWYWLDPESGAMATGWYRDGAVWYYSDGSGAMLANRWLKQGGTWYYLNPSGAMRTGWLHDKGAWYWLDRSSGAMATGFVDDGGTAYYCDGSGRMAANRWLGSTKSGWCWAQASGALATGWGYLSGKWYYFDPASPQHRAKTGLYSVGDSQCFSDADGALYMNRWVNINADERRYANNQGYLEGRQLRNSSGAFSFVDAEGNPLSGWQVIGGQHFYAHPDTGEMATGWLKLDNTWYYLNSQGIRQTGWVKLDGTWFLLGSDGAMKTGWQKLGGTWYYLHDSGAMATGWLKLSDTWYYLESSGAMATGWRTIGGISYYFDSSGAWVSSDARMTNLAQQFHSNTPWLIMIDTTNCMLGVFKGSAGNWTSVSSWPCSPGKASTPTVLGEYTVGLKGYSFGSGFTCYWWTQFYGDYLIHSEVYYQNTFTWMEGTMGVPGSHGCIRLPIDQAKWIYDNIPTGTKVYTYR
ncbi:L,D-transpeptidase family protein [Paraeggerthella hongkongensis]|uniref:L,D-TPase catalytic domain-containing protein n=1 Tax=Paraeggerthella hongkongensis TaxID=230658 RepID=A0A3N0AU67_9ACTN|nr:L,D-transpeptidase family protein [Paraeggerthella hongkongensis]RNL38385.1 hypothetical protein DMP08_11955 [Paraeggerthella hongkongensis]